MFGSFGFYIDNFPNEPLRGIALKNLLHSSFLQYDIMK